MPAQLHRDHQHCRNAAVTALPERSLFIQELPQNSEGLENHRPGMNSRATSGENPLRWVRGATGFNRFSFDVAVDFNPRRSPWENEVTPVCLSSRISLKLWQSEKAPPLSTVCTLPNSPTSGREPPKVSLRLARPQLRWGAGLCWRSGFTRISPPCAGSRPAGVWRRANVRQIPTSHRAGRPSSKAG